MFVTQILTVTRLKMFSQFTILYDQAKNQFTAQSTASSLNVKIKHKTHNLIDIIPHNVQQS